MARTLLPTLNYGLVENKIFRGSYPHERNFPFLKALCLKSIISLIPESPDEKLLKFCEENSVKSFFFRIEVPEDKITLKYKKVSQILSLITDPDEAPIYVHCTDGRRVTGTVFMCLRKMQFWSFGSIINEHSRYIKNHEIERDDMDFVNKFVPDGELLQRHMNNTQEFPNSNSPNENGVYSGSPTLKHHIY